MAVSARRGGGLLPPVEFAEGERNPWNGLPRTPSPAGAAEMDTMKNSAHNNMPLAKTDNRRLTQRLAEKRALGNPCDSVRIRANSCGFVRQGYSIDSGYPNLLCFLLGRPRIPLAIASYGAGSTATACWSRRKNSLPRYRDVRRLKRNVNSSK